MCFVLQHFGPIRPSRPFLVPSVPSRIGPGRPKQTSWPLPTKPQNSRDWLQNRAKKRQQDWGPKKTNKQKTHKHFPDGPCGTIVPGTNPHPSQGQTGQNGDFTVELNRKRPVCPRDRSQFVPGRGPVCPRDGSCLSRHCPSQNVYVYWFFSCPKESWFHFDAATCRGVREHLPVRTPRPQPHVFPTPPPSSLLTLSIKFVDSFLRKSLVSVKFLSATRGPGMAAPISWAPRISVLFLQENPPCP